jgi:hypothetical protein
MTTTQTRGIRNNNPGNIRLGQPWQGLAAEQTDGSFCQFVAPEWGIRAIVKIIQAYLGRGADSVTKIISIWAPPNENNTAAYIEGVANMMGVDPTGCLNFQDNNVWVNLIKGIIQHENGQQPYSDAIIQKGIDLALSNT